MKAFLMFKDRDFDIERSRPPNEAALLQDLELETLFGAMAGGDAVVHEVAKVAVLTAADNDVKIIEYRQSILADSLNNPSAVRTLYAFAVEAIERQRKVYFGLFRDSPATVLNNSVALLQIFMDVLVRIRSVADQRAHSFRSEGFQSLFTMLQRELSDEYFREVDRHLRQLKFDDGLLMSAELGSANKGVKYVLRKGPGDRRNWFMRLFPRRLGGFTLHLHPRDEAGWRALSDLRDRGLALAATALKEFADHILSFFQMLRTELAFYVGCINLHEKLSELGSPVAFPRALGFEECSFACEGLYDICLALSMNRAVVGNDVAAEDKQLVMITGANQGGKSTFLRSVGLAQLMMQSGLFVPARAFHANIVEGVFTHYKREEDTSMQSGKLDEELNRMSGLIDILSPHAMLLFNKSFASTNEREGSQIAQQISCALVEGGVKVFFVTHLYEFARRMDELRMEHALFLRADRKDDGTRTFRLIEGKPLDTSFGEDLYRRIFKAPLNQVREPASASASA